MPLSINFHYIKFFNFFEKKKTKNLKMEEYALRTTYDRLTNHWLRNADLPG